jgi:hypothetical protein
MKYLSIIVLVVLVGCRKEPVEQRFANVKAHIFVSAKPGTESQTIKGLSCTYNGTKVTSFKYNWKAEGLTWDTLQDVTIGDSVYVIAGGNGTNPVLSVNVSISDNLSSSSAGGLCPSSDVFGYSASLKAHSSQ